MSHQHNLSVSDPEKGTLDVPYFTEDKSATTTLVSPSVTSLIHPMEDAHLKQSLASKEEGPLKPSPMKVPPLPKKRASKWVRWNLWFNTYRKFFVLSLTLNIIALALAASGHFPYAVKYSGAMVLGNLNFAILMRNELFGRILYLIINTLFAKWTPLWWRLGCTSVLQHLGGLHSGCALAAIMWLIFKLQDMFRHMSLQHDAILVTGVVTNVAVVIAAAAAVPWVRNTHHNIFERNHRLFGWTALLATWAFVIMGDTYNPVTRSWDMSGADIIRHQDFWFTAVMTFFIVLPWVCVRKVPIDIELPSPKAAIIRFKGGMQQGLLGRISRSPLLEYHAFGTISEGKSAEYHYIVAGVQGDFTKSLVNDPPTHLYTRIIRFAGVSNTSTLYKRGIRVCTGTGIGAALSTCLQSPDWFLIWIGSDQEKTFGPTISGLIRDRLAPNQYLLWDSKTKGGRPDTMSLVKKACKDWNAEVVFITSNYTGNTEIMEGCKEAGIPAFGTLWDF